MIRFFCLLIAVGLLSVIGVLAQGQTLRQVIIKSKGEPIPYAVLYYQAQKKWFTADSLGKMVVDLPEGVSVVISATGFNTDTLTVPKYTTAPWVINLLPVFETGTVEVDGLAKTTFMDLQTIHQEMVITSRELGKAACCNLAESFETNPVVDVNYTDAVTGARQIQMLGLSGVYAPVQAENVPVNRGISANYGLGLLPGPWLQSIRVARGVGSVVNGYESITGQIDADIIGPQSKERIWLNAYLNSFGRSEANAIINQALTPKIKSTLLLHGNYWNTRIDRNNDGFLDMPISKGFSAMNKWRYQSEKGWMAQAGIKITYEDRQGGQTQFRNENRGSATIYGLGTLTQRVEGYSKLGKASSQKPWRSFGWIQNAWTHYQDNYFGLRAYNAQQGGYQTQIIGQTILGNTNRQLRGGLSFSFENTQESLEGFTYLRKELNIGAYAEFTHYVHPKLTLVYGIRADHNNLFGTFLTPRFHAKWDVQENLVLRAVVGQGRRTPFVIAENMGFLATSRLWNLPLPAAGKAYGFNQELASNSGISLSKEGKLWYRPASLSVDYYYTHFRRQVVADVLASADRVDFYQINNGAFAHSFQIQADWKMHRRLDIRLAYRYFNAQTQFNSIGWRQRPLITPHRAFINLAYANKSGWKADATLQWNGVKLLPNTSKIHSDMGTWSPRYVVLQAQISKKIREATELYIGGENLLDFVQHPMVIHSEQPFHTGFDASVAWGPLMGRMLYLGFRYKV